MAGIIGMARRPACATGWSAITRVGEGSRPVSSAAAAVGRVLDPAMVAASRAGQAARHRSKVGDLVQVASKGARAPVVRLLGNPVLVGPKAVLRLVDSPAVPRRQRRGPHRRHDPRPQRIIVRRGKPTAKACR
jgi:hypothetical protein